jgi:4-hydroxy-3-polyprenylbenzoate decarboxylase
VDDSNLDDMIDYSVGRALDLFGIDSGDVRRWGKNFGPSQGAQRP